MGYRRWMHLHAAALSGVSSLIGHPGRAPLPPPFELGLYPVGINLAAATLAAHFGVAAAGHAQVVEVDAAKVLFHYMWTAVAISSMSSDPFVRRGRRFPGSGGAYPFALFPCADGYVALIGRTAADWRALLTMMGDPAWAQDERFGDPVKIALRWADEADKHLVPWLSTQTRANLTKLGRDVGFPLAPVNHVTEVLQEPQFVARESIVSDIDIAGQPISLLRYPYHFGSALPAATEGRSELPLAARARSNRPSPPRGGGKSCWTVSESST